MNEKAVTSHVILEAAQRDVTLLRNNSGGFYDKNNRFVRYGLGSFDEKDEMKSSDWIGWTPTLILPHHVGSFLPVFTAIEMKPDDWKFYNADKRALHQKNFIDMVLKAGGNAGFAQNVADFKRIIKHEP